MSINLNSLVSKIIAKPCTKQGEVLYARVDGLMDTSSSTTKPASQAYQIGIKKKYNSPDNLRRLFITYNGVYTQYHHTIFGASSTRLLREQNFEPNDIPDIAFRQQVAKNGLTRDLTADGLRVIARNNNISEYSFLQGFGLRALFKPWVYNNIEEIYFDWIVLTACANQGGVDISQYGDITNPQQMPSIITKLLCDACSVKTLTEVLVKYPRLHTVGFILDLENVFQAQKGLLINEPKDLDTRQQSWIQRAIPTINPAILPNKAYVSNKATVLQLQTPEVWFSNYTLKESIYLFDVNILKDHFSKLVAQAKPNNISNVANTVLTETDETLSSQFTTIQNTYGNETLLILIKTNLILNIISKEVVLKVLKDKEQFKSIYEHINQLN